MKNEESAGLVASFSIDVWREDVALDVERCKVVRTHIEKTFSGALVGTSVGEMTMGHAGDGCAAYMGFERFDVAVRSPGHALDGRSVSSRCFTTRRVTPRRAAAPGSSKRARALAGFGA